MLLFQNQADWSLSTSSRKFNSCACQSLADREPKLLSAPRIKIIADHPAKNETSLSSFEQLELHWLKIHDSTWIEICGHNYVLHIAIKYCRRKTSVLHKKCRISLWPESHWHFIKVVPVKVIVQYNKAFSFDAWMYQSFQDSWFWQRGKRYGPAMETSCGDCEDSRQVVAAAHSCKEILCRPQVHCVFLWSSTRHHDPDQWTKCTLIIGIHAVTLGSIFISGLNGRDWFTLLQPVRQSYLPIHGGSVWDVLFRLNWNQAVQLQP